MFTVISDSSLRETHVFRRYYSNNRTIMNSEKKNPVLKKDWTESLHAYKHSWESCKRNDLKESEHKVQSKSS